MATRSKRKRSRAVSKAPQMRVIDVGNQVWLAGLGALARAQKGGPKLFQALVKEGRTVQTDTRESTQAALSHALGELREGLDTRTEAVRDKASETWDNVEKIFQSRVHTALQQLGVPTAGEISALARKVDRLNHSVQELARTRAAERRISARRSRSSAGTADTTSSIV